MTRSFQLPAFGILFRCFARHANVSCTSPIRRESMRTLLSFVVGGQRFTGQSAPTIHLTLLAAVAVLSGCGGGGGGSTVPSTNPAAAPTVAPTTHPTATPTVAPTTHPTATPTVAPTTHPTATPTATPTPTTSPTSAERIYVNTLQAAAETSAVASK
jgi:hypothetical protein